MPEEETTENTELESTDLDMDQIDELIDLAEDELNNEAANGEQQ